jgi:hypothetical protein
MNFPQGEDAWRAENDRLDHVGAAHESAVHHDRGAARDLRVGRSGPGDVGSYGPRIRELEVAFDSLTVAVNVEIGPKLDFQSTLLGKPNFSQHERIVSPDVRELGCRKSFQLGLREVFSPSYSRVSLMISPLACGMRRHHPQ